MTSAMAADLAVRAPAAASTRTFDWAGFYVGGAMGARVADPESTTTSFDPALNPTVGPDARRSYDNTAFYAKGYAGQNWHIAPSWIAGVEGSFGWGNNKRTTQGLPGAPTRFSSVLDTAYINADWDASIRGRLGVLIAPAWLLYGTAGVAWQNIGFGSNCVGAFVVNACAFSHSEANSITRTGWTVGGGLENMLSAHWIVRLEYSYADFGTFTHTFFPAAVGPGFDDRWTADIKNRTHTATVGMSYRF
ncbi:porin family protein [Bradyrhizobium betae]|uniref:Porin family protein n=2 Tax=Bradyrhizobium betae TaxID=244734 RepID=A0A5P6PGG5_9BRAD|nr:porin family protein [Bradyrhizobium betae]